MNKEQADKLKKFLPFTATDFLYVPEAFREAYPDDKDKWPVFTLKPKTGIQVAYLEDEMTVGADQQIHVNTGSIRIKTLETGIVNIKNWGDVKFKRDDITKKIDMKIISMMPADLQTELMNAITEKSELTEEELEGLK